MKKLLGVVVAVSVIVAGSTAVAQSAYPEKPIHVVVGRPLGSGLDVVARHLSQSLATALRQPVVVENLAGGDAAMERVAQAAPDGYTLVFAANSTIVVNPSLYKLPYDLARDFAPISQVTAWPALLVVDPTGATAVAGGEGELLAGSSFGEGNQVLETLRQYRQGNLHALTDAPSTRSPAAPDVAWHGLLAPAGTPPGIVKRLHLATVQALTQPELHAKLADLGFEVVGNSPEEFAAIIKSETRAWATVINDSGMRPH